MATQQHPNAPRGKMYYIAVEFKEDLVARDGEDLEWPLSLLTDIFHRTHHGKEGIMRHDDRFWWVDYQSVKDCQKAWSLRTRSAPQWDFEQAMIVDGDGNIVEDLLPEKEIIVLV